jgi:hypothetical protein
VMIVRPAAPTPRPATNRCAGDIRMPAPFLDGQA